MGSMIGESDGRFQLSDGRSLGYCELGDPQGELIFFVGGYPGSRWMAYLFAGSLRPGIRLVGIDRPGMGLSDFKPGWRMLDWLDDLVELANHFQHDRFAILGWSGGTPYMAACAYKIPGYLSACGLLACMGPSEVSVKGAMLVPK